MHHQKVRNSNFLLWGVVVVLVANIVFFSYALGEIKKDYTFSIDLISKEVGELRSNLLDRQNEILALKSEVYMLNRQLAGISDDFGTISNRIDLSLIHI